MKTKDCGGISALNGKTIDKIEFFSWDNSPVVDPKEGAYEIIFTCTDGKRYRMWHDQNCCESVNLEDICGDLGDIIGAKIIEASERDQKGSGLESETWTFYRIQSVKGEVVLRWYGTSNGYYSESVDFEEMIDG